VVVEVVAEEQMAKLVDLELAAQVVEYILVVLEILQ
jgi:hypothetical protein